jgi:hypothetical protein
VNTIVRSVADALFPVHCSFFALIVVAWSFAAFCDADVRCTLPLIHDGLRLYLAVLPV